VVRSIGTAIAASAPGDTIRVVGNGGATYLERIVISHDLTIEGGWRADFQVRDPRIYVSVVRDTTQFRNAVIRVDGAARVTLDGLTVIGGRLGVIAPAGAHLVIRDCNFRGQLNLARGFGDQPGAAIHLTGGTLLAERVDTRDGVTAFAGAALALINVSSATVRDCSFSRATSSPFGATGTFDPAPGGGMLVRNSTVLFERVTVTECAAALNEAGGIYATGSTLDFRNCEFRQCLSPTLGGAMLLVDCPRVTFADGRIEGSLAGQGAGIAALRVSSLEITGTTVTSNTTLPSSSGSSLAREGAGLWINSCGFALRDCTLDTNNVPAVQAVRGGGVWCQASVGVVENTVIRGERALGSGGGWFQIGGDVIFRGCELSGNTSGFYGGATHIELGGRIRMEGCLVEGNQARFGGGSSASFTARMEVDHCTFTGNAGETSGASFYLDTAARAVISNTIACCAPAGGQLYCSASTAEVTYSNFWDDDAVNVRVEYGGGCPDPTGTLGNLKLDPVFCTGAPGFSLSATSPCVGAASDGGDIGWAGTGCARPLSLVPESWGRIKSRYASPD
jgi:hypothetical protein